MSKQHATLSASGAHRWAHCTGSRKAEDGLADKRSVFADEGSAAHELCEICLERNDSPFNWVGDKLIEYNEHTVDQEMAESVQMYLDYVYSVKGARMVEVQVDFSEWVPEGFGTSDCLITSDDSLHVVDFKYGKGKQVYAENNLQGVLYALGAYAMCSDIFEIKTVTIVIVQPRLDHIDEWTLPVEELLKIGAWLADRAEEAMTDDAPRSPGESQCQFCKAKATCPALKKMTEDTVIALFDDEATPDKLSDADLGKALENAKLIKAWLDAVEAHVKERLNAGEPFPGYKLVAGRTSRDWADDESVIANRLLENFDVERDDLYESKFLTPAKAEKLVGKRKKELAELISSSTGAPTLVPESDKRPAVNVSAADFDEVV